MGYLAKRLVLARVNARLGRSWNHRNRHCHADNLLTPRTRTLKLWLSDPFAQDHEENRRDSRILPEPDIKRVLARLRHQAGALGFFWVWGSKAMAPHEVYISRHRPPMNSDHNGLYSAPHIIGMLIIPSNLGANLRIGRLDFC